jgi:hypothetical protein
LQPQSSNGALGALGGGGGSGREDSPPQPLLLQPQPLFPLFPMLPHPLLVFPHPLLLLHPLFPQQNKSSKIQIQLFILGINSFLL